MLLLLRQKIKELLDFTFRLRSNIKLMTQIEIPSELPTILRNFTLSVLRTKPNNIIDYAVDYFTQQQQSQLMIGDNIITAVPLSSISHYEQQQQQTSKPNAIPAGQAEDFFSLFSKHKFLYLDKWQQCYIYFVEHINGNTLHLIYRLLFFFSNQRSIFFCVRLNRSI